ncbi:hypothetical protein M5K25_013056 [Dendrobium thyrsiflorum]|uniref:Uncharacterized protein n=1 Tax=Dendrobium thyrsiflorum TaxID=117978 RepID=A0ABD0V5N8_DENTH
MAGRIVEALEVEIGQMKSKISDLQTQISYYKSQIAAVHEKIDGEFSIMEEMLKKLFEGQTKILPSKVREAADSQGSGENPKPIRRREDQEVEILEGAEKMPHLEPIPREESGREYVERREGLGHERRDVEFERRGPELERFIGPHDFGYLSLLHSLRSGNCS